MVYRNGKTCRTEVSGGSCSHVAVLFSFKTIKYDNFFFIVRDLAASKAKNLVVNRILQAEFAVVRFQFS